MSKGFEASAHIARSPAEVWAWLTDWPRMPDWMMGIDHMELDGEGPVGAGTRLRFRARGAERTSEIVAWSPPHRLVLRARQGGMSAVYAYDCTPEAGGTRLTLRASCEARGLGWRLAAPLIGYLMERVDSKQPMALKYLVEDAPADHP